MSLNIIDKINSKLEYLITEGKEALRAKEALNTQPVDDEEAIPSYSELFIKQESLQQSSLSWWQMAIYDLNSTQIWSNLLSIFNLKFNAQTSKSLTS
jgi:hypothetical protein